MRKLIVFFILVFGLNAYGQRNTTNQFSLNVLTPSAEYELSLANNATIDMNLGIGFSYVNSLGDSYYGIYPGFELQYRYYYNFFQRFDDERKVSQNSANYITGIASITGGDPIFGDLKYSSNYGVLIGPAWGLQRVYENNFKLNINLGVGYGFAEEGDSYIAPIISVELGWVLEK